MTLYVGREGLMGAPARRSGRSRPRPASTRTASTARSTSRIRTTGVSVEAGIPSRPRVRALRLPARRQARVPGGRRRRVRDRRPSSASRRSATRSRASTRSTTTSRSTCWSCPSRRTTSPPTGRPGHRSDHVRAAQDPRRRRQEQPARLAHARSVADSGSAAHPVRAELAQPGRRLRRRLPLGRPRRAADATTTSGRTT